MNDGIEVGAEQKNPTAQTPLRNVGESVFEQYIVEWQQIDLECVSLQCGRDGEKTGFLADSNTVGDNSITLR